MEVGFVLNCETVAVYFYRAHCNYLCIHQKTISTRAYSSTVMLASGSYSSLANGTVSSFSFRSTLPTHCSSSHKLTRTSILCNPFVGKLEVFVVHLLQCENALTHFDDCKHAEVCASVDMCVTY